MKRILFALSILLFSHSVKAQSVEVVNLMNDRFMTMDMMAETINYDNVKIYFSRSSARQLVKKLTKWNELVNELAYSNSLSSTPKHKIPMTGTAKYDVFSYTYKDKKRFDSDYFVVPAFIYDDSGISYLQLRGYHRSKDAQKNMYEFNFECKVSSVNIGSWIEEIKETIEKF